MEPAYLNSSSFLYPDVIDTDTDTDTDELAYILPPLSNVSSITEREFETMIYNNVYNIDLFKDPRFEERINWKNIWRRGENFPTDFLEAFYHKVKKYNLCISKLTSQFIINHINEYDLHEIVRYFYRFDEVLLEYIFTNFKSDSELIRLCTEDQKMSFALIEKYEDMLDPLLLARYQQLTFSNILKYAKKVPQKDIENYWHAIEYNQSHLQDHEWAQIIHLLPSPSTILEESKVSEKFIWDHIDYFKDHPEEMLYGDRSEGFFLEYIDRIPVADEKEEIDMILRNGGITERVILKILARIQNNINLILRCEYQISESLIELYENVIDWGDVSSSQNLSETFITKHFDKLNFEWVQEYSELSERFIEEHIDQIDWYVLLRHQKLSQAFINKHYKRFVEDQNTFYCLFRQQLSDTFLRKLIRDRKLLADDIAETQNFSLSFMKDHCELLDLDIVLDNKKLSAEVKKNAKSMLHSHRFRPLRPESWIREKKAKKKMKNKMKMEQNQDREIPLWKRALYDLFEGLIEDARDMPL